MKPIILLFMILAGIFPCHASGTPEKTEDGKPVKFCGFLLEQAGRRQKITFNFLAFFSGIKLVNVNSFPDDVTDCHSRIQ